jgi:hexosaminidase
MTDRNQSKRSIHMPLAGLLLLLFYWDNASAQTQQKTSRADPAAMTHVVPRPKRLEMAPGSFSLNSKTLIVTTSTPAARTEARRFAERMSSALGLKLAVAVSAKSNRRAIRFELVEALADIPQNPDKDEAYRIVVEPAQIRLLARSDRGLFYATQTLFDLVERTGTEFVIPACRVEDWPEFPWRGLLVAPGQSFMSLPALKYNIDEMARSKLNLLHLHMTDNLVFTPQIRSYPQVVGNLQRTATSKQNQFYTKEQLRELVAYAAERKVDILPAIEIPGHAMAILQYIPELSCKPESGPVSKSTFCIGSDASYRFVEKLIGELAEVFPFQYIHIGTDEVEFTDVPQAGGFFNWEECTICRERRKQEGLKDVRALFYYFTRRTDAAIKKHGKRMMMWNDQIDVGQPQAVDLPRDIMMHYWRIAEKGRGPWENCSYDKFLELGFPVVNSWYPETYIDIYIKEEKLARWNPLNVPPLPDQKYRKQIRGSTLCAWAGLDIYPRVLPSAIPFFADRVWNLEPIEDTKAFARRLPRHIFGPYLPLEMDSLYEALGGMILPLQLEEGMKAHPKTSLSGLTLEQKRAAYQDLLRVMDRVIGEARIQELPSLREYRESVRWLLEQLDKKQ